MSQFFVRRALQEALKAVQAKSRQARRAHEGLAREYHARAFEIGVDAVDAPLLLNPFVRPQTPFIPIRTIKE